MNTKYKYLLEFYHRPTIHKVEISRETTVSVMYMDEDGKERKASKTSRHHSYHDTWDEARDRALVMADERVAHARRTLEVETGRLGNIKGMKNPEAA